MISEIADIVTCLLKLRQTLDDPTPNDHISKTFNVDAAHYDIQHVREKLPKASRVIADRLGRANWRRRHYLIGLQNLKQPETNPYGGLQKQPSFAKELRPSLELPDSDSSIGEEVSSVHRPHSADARDDTESSVAWSRDSKSSNAPTGTNPTTAPSFSHVAYKKPPAKAMPLTGHLPVRQITDAGQSQRSVPPAPSMLLTGKSFRCSYCGLELVNYKQNKQWR